LAPIDLQADECSILPTKLAVRNNTWLAMKRVKAVQVNKPKNWRRPPPTRNERPQKKIENYELMNGGRECQNSLAIEPEGRLYVADVMPKSLASFALTYMASKTVRQMRRLVVRRSVN